MADEKAQVITPDELIVIGEIRRIENELRTLGVRVKSANLDEMTDEELNDELESVSDQLKARKRW